MQTAPTSTPGREAHALAQLLERHARWFVLTGAGCSTASGIPDYRDTAGDWKRPAPMTLQAFLGTPAARARYWSRSMVGWRRMRAARPNAAHRALARMERDGHVDWLLTQNVDGLHQAAGSVRVTDLHGRIDRVRCLGCERRSAREAFQDRLEALNPTHAGLQAPAAPDGDADLEAAGLACFEVPDCTACGSILKPDVVFFGENVPRTRFDEARARLDAADAVLVVGSSLMVHSGFRFVRAAAIAGKPVACVNRGRTRADDLFTLKVEADCGDVLEVCARLLGGA